MSAELDELKDLTRALRRRASMSDASDWTSGRGAKAADAAAPESAPKTAPAKPARNAAPIAAARSGSLDELATKIQACRACELGKYRLQAVPGVGARDAKVMMIGEGPGFQEDHTGEPFVGRSGQLLDKILESIGLSRKTNVYIANIVKCHPMKNPSDPESHGNDRPPTPEEMDECRGWLEAQIRAIKPKVLVTLGASPAKALLRDQTPITKLRGQWRTFDPGGGLGPIKLLPTFHPAALLRNPELKKDVWEDMKSLRQELSK
ncbi:MAG: uracil-DNA glycosylase [Elusimicrobiota bacterium]|nr:MAG: uracil-DNA glycosylase [Elusimicrobiota bacterium]